MHRILQSYLSQFVKENELSSLSESEQFERFVNYCQIYRFYPASFDVQEVSTGVGDDSIDGAAVLISEELILTIEEANLIFDTVRPRQTVNVKYVFLQAKRSEGFDPGEILKFGQGVHNLLSDDAYDPAIAKYQLAGNKLPALNSKKLDRLCEKIIEPLKVGGRASLPPFQDAIKVIESVGKVTRDRLKRQPCLILMN